MTTTTTLDQFEAGQYVTVTQQVPRWEGSWPIKTTGCVVRYEQKKTGSWYAHSRDDKLWLDRLVLKKEDGEIVTLNLDEFSHVQPAPTPPENPTATPKTPQADSDTGTNDNPQTDQAGSSDAGEA